MSSLCIQPSIFMVICLCEGESIFIAPGISVYHPGTDITRREASEVSISVPCDSTSRKVCHSCISHEVVLCTHFIFARSLCHLIFGWVDRQYVRSLKILVRLSPGCWPKTM